MNNLEFVRLDNPSNKERFDNIENFLLDLVSVLKNEISTLKESNKRLIQE